MAKPTRRQVLQAGQAARTAEAAARTAEAQARRLRSAANTATQHYERLLMEFNGQMTLLDTEDD